VGVGAHVYLAAWIGLAATLGLVAWPGSGTARRRAALAGATLSGFLAAAAWLFLLHEGREAPYFARSGKHNVLVEMRQWGSPAPLVWAAADALVAPWLPDPEPRHDIPGARRLPLIAGLALAAALARAIARPAGDLSAYLLSHAGAAVIACIAWGEALSPNGSRFGYLTSWTAVAVAAGLLWAISAVPPPRRRATALAALGLVAMAGCFGARDLARWADLQTTFDRFIGQETLVGRAALRWDRYGEVRLESPVLYSPLVVETIRRLRVAPRSEAALTAGPPPSRQRVFRFLPPGASAEPGKGERVVELLRDAWGREWGVVVGLRL
jgi:hypothetical protein